MQICAPLNNESIPFLQQIEVATFFQLPSFHIVGLPSPEVAEARERIRSAIEASGMEFPRRRVILNLSPASIRKRGTGLDLPMALAILAHGKEMKIQLGAWGELGLDGAVKPAGQITRTLYAAWRGRLSHFIVSQSEYSDAVRALEVIHQSGELQGVAAPFLIPVKTLMDAWDRFSSDLSFDDKQRSWEQNALASKDQIPSNEIETPVSTSSLLPLSPSLERMVGVAAAGHHHFLVLGPRGTGKSQALEWLIALKSFISPQERLNQSLLAELGRFCHAPRASSEKDFVPVRRISSQVKASALIGSAYSLTIRPGEYSLAHGGLLIADELPEWSRDSRESLREPLERAKITLTRTQGSLELPAQFLMAASGNLCPCGGWPPQIPIPEKQEKKRDMSQKSLSLCKCSHSVRKAYLERLSGPVLDRIDLVVLVMNHSWAEMSAVNRVSDSRVTVEGLKKKVIKIRRVLVEEWGKPPGLLSGYEVEAILQAHPQWDSWLSRLFEASLRSRHKISRLALTLAAWDECGQPQETHFIEAAYYRPEKLLF